MSTDETPRVHPPTSVFSATAALRRAEERLRAQGIEERLVLTPDEAEEGAARYQAFRDSLPEEWRRTLDEGPGTEAEAAE